MMQTAFVVLLLAAWMLISVGAAVVWGGHCRQAGWREGFDDGYKNAIRFADELRRTTA